MAEVFALSPRKRSLSRFKLPILKDDQITEETKIGESQENMVNKTSSEDFVHFLQAIQDSQLKTKQQQEP